MVKAFDSIDDTTPTTVVDIRTQVMDFWDRGLLGLAVDPGFLAAGAAARPYLYVYYVYDAPPGRHRPRLERRVRGLAQRARARRPTAASSRRSSSRYTINTATNVAVPGIRGRAAPRRCAQFPSHSGGAMVFGDDGQLYLADGDGASYTVADYGQRGGTVPNADEPDHADQPVRRPASR